MINFNYLVKSVFIFSILFSFGCSYLQIARHSPKAKITTIKALGVTPIAVKFSAQVEIENPYDFEVRINKAHIIFISEGKTLINFDNPINKSVGPKQKETFDLDFQIEYADMGPAISDFIMKSELNTELKSEIELSFPDSWDLPKKYVVKSAKKELIKLR